MKSKLVILLPCLFLFLGCIDEREHIEFPQGEVNGFKPIYGTADDIYEIDSQGIKPMISVGKIILVGTTLFVNERHQGIHIINNLDPTKPIQTGFIKIPGNLELSKKGDFIYANNMEDLITLQLAANGDVIVTDRKSNIFPEYAKAENLISTLPEGSFFECIDSSKGLVIGWEVSKVHNPNCYR